MNTLETHEVPRRFVNIPDNYFNESQNSEEYCKEMRRKINLSYEELKKIYKEQIERLPEDTKDDVALLLNEKCKHGHQKHTIYPVGFVKRVLNDMISHSDKRKQDRKSVG